MKDMKRFLYAPDPHGDEVHRPSWDVAMSFCKDFNPHRRILGGDVWDFRPFRRGASEDEQRESIRGDLEAGLGLMQEFQPTDHCIGNHDIRPWRMRDESDGWKRDYAAAVVEQIEAAHEKLKCRTYGYRIDERCQLGPGLSAIHGFAHNIHAAKTTAEAYPGGTMAGHVHSVAYFRTASFDIRECWLTGCLRNVMAPFNQTRLATFRHTHGFAWGWYSETAPVYQVNQATAMQDGRWIVNANTYGSAA